MLYNVASTLKIRINGFRPCPGKITNYHQPGGHGIRVDAHVYAGYVIPPYYDSLISKLITVAQTREEAITKMERALEEYYIEGVMTTIPFPSTTHEKRSLPKAGDFTTKFMDDFCHEESKNSK
jgi:acetyl-CoA carboxylase, biotin carboxylase subunit